MEETLKKKSDSKFRTYDRVVRFCQFNSVTGLLFVAFAKQEFQVIDISNPKYTWALPIVENSLALCCLSDQDKLVVAYDNNQVVVYDLLNKKLHEWSKTHMDKLPKNFLNRYNRMVGIV